MNYNHSERYRQYMRDEYNKGYQDGFAESSPNGLRRSRNGILLGVCQGFADWLEIPAWPLRVAAIIAFFASGFYPVGLLYLAAAVFMTPARR
jgi:phage shock protein PspC (stress-responsive transcriptional regulator)